MQSSMDTNLDKPCEICGGDGNADLIATCIKCDATREHIYCMLKIRLEGPEDWVCQSCSTPESAWKEDTFTPSDVVQHDVMHVSGPSKVPDNSSWRAHSNWRKAPNFGKVKFIPEEEVIRLSSGSTQWNTLSPKCGFSKFKAPISKRTPIKFKSVAPKFSPVKKPPRFGSLQIISNITQHTSQTLKETKEKCIVVAESKMEHDGNKKLVDALTISSKVEMLNVEVEKELSKASYRVLPPRHSLFIASSGGNISSVAEDKHSDVEERMLPNFLYSFHLYRSYLPAQSATWKGRFILDTYTCGETFGGYQAQPPCKVSRKAYQFTKNMPPALNVKLIPQFQLFQNDCPNLQDISLYFFPVADIKRSKQSQDQLFKCLEVKNLMLISYIDNVELLIFTSKQLSLDSQNVMAMTKAEKFLFGIFRSVRKAPKKNPFAAPPLKCASDDQAKLSSELDDCGTIDMEVDMIGGKNVGRVDVVVRKKISFGFTKTNGKMIGRSSSSSSSSRAWQ